ncbi:unnamed protein product [Fraxinus pennsylvanica]|uniref:Uncharacterized protein n=1 Tax=Fraxinus pennsylvanica TaxID=56036 RepID=A0AAD2A982_9LAMI|nr:unnamed protein product [Fraxinus pennsylvanica]
MRRNHPLKSSKSSVNVMKTTDNYDDAEALSTMARTGTKQRLIAEDILRHGSVRVAGEVFTFRELASATENFNPELLIGEGGFGRVYKGYLKNTNQVVFLSRLWLLSNLTGMEYKPRLPSEPG